MTASFERSPGKLAIQDGVIYNPSIGLTAQGGIDFEHNQIDLSGSFVPAYTVNTMLTKIPLVGLLLSGGENDGVFGISYRVHGSMSRSDGDRQSAVGDRPRHLAPHPQRDRRDDVPRRRCS